MGKGLSFIFLFLSILSIRTSCLPEPISHTPQNLPQRFHRWDGTVGSFGSRITGDQPITSPVAGESFGALQLYGEGINRSESSLPAAISHIESSGKVGLIMNPGTWVLDRDLTVPANSQLVMPPGAVISIPAGKKLTITGGFEAGMHQVFSGKGNVLFAEGSVHSVNPIWWGAVGDGKTDSTLAFKAAASAGPAVYIPAGSFLLTDTVHVAMSKLRGSGTGNTRLIFKNMSGKDGLSFTAPQRSGVEGGVSELSIIASGQHGRKAICTPKDGALYHTYRTRFTFENLEFRGERDVKIPSGFNTDFGWQICIDQGDGWGVYIRNIDIVGTFNIAANPVGQHQQTGIRLDAESNILSARIENITMHGCWRGIDIGRRCFFFIDNCDIAHAWQGIYSSHAIGEGYGEGKVSDTLLNAQETCIYFHNTSWRSISNVNLGRHKNGYNHGGEWYGIKLNNVDKTWLSNIRAQVDKSLTQFKGVAYGFWFNDCDGLSCTGLTPGLGLDYHVQMSNCVGLTFSSTQFLGTTGTGFNFINKTRNVDIGPYFFSRGVSPEFTFDNSIDRKTIQIRSR